MHVHYEYATYPVTLKHIVTLDIFEDDFGNVKTFASPWKQITRP